MGHLIISKDDLWFLKLDHRHLIGVWEGRHSILAGSAAEETGMKTFSHCVSREEVEPVLLGLQVKTVGTSEEPLQRVWTTVETEVGFYVCPFARNFPHPWIGEATATIPVGFVIDDITFFDGENVSVSTMFIVAPSAMGKVLSFAGLPSEPEFLVSYEKFWLKNIGGKNA